jgi:hypothetical protein
MNPKAIKYNGSIEINDLFDDAVKNAVARRNQAIDSQDVLSDEETKSIVGGIVGGSKAVNPVAIGLIALPPKPPIITGRIAAPETLVS